MGACSLLRKPQRAPGRHTYAPGRHTYTCPALSLVISNHPLITAAVRFINHESVHDPFSIRQLQLLPTELKAQSTLQIDSDLILSAILTGLLAQLATAVKVITKVPGLIPSDEWSIHLGMPVLGLEYSHSLPATPNI